MKRVVVMVANLFGRDPRIYKEVRSLSANGYEVLVICWDQRKQRSREEVVDGVKIKNIRVPFSTKFLQPHRTPCLLAFWLQSLFELLGNNFDIVHCCEIYTVPIGIFLKKIRKIKLIYDSYEHYPSLARNVMPRIMYELVASADRLFVGIADCIIVPSEERCILYPQARKTLIVLNSPKYVEIRKKKKNKIFTIFYAGGLGKQSGVNLVIEAVKQIKGAKLILAGWGPRIRAFDEISAKNRDIVYIGEITREEASNRLSEADATFAFYEPSNLNNVYTASCKVFDAMMVGIPVIVNEEAASANIIIHNKCGLAVPYGNFSKLKEAIVLLKRDPYLRMKLGANGKCAFKQRYDWSILEREFVKSYNDAICSKCG